MKSSLILDKKNLLFAVCPPHHVVSSAGLIHNFSLSISVLQKEIHYYKYRKICSQQGSLT